MNRSEPVPHGWTRLIEPLKNMWQEFVMAIATEEVLAERMDYDKRLARRPKNCGRDSSASRHAA